MRVAVNLLWLVPGVVGGTENHATGLLRGLVGRDDLDLVLVVLPSFAGAHPELAEAFDLVEAPLPAGRHVVRRVLTESSWLGQQLRAMRPAAVHHFGGIVPVGVPGPSVVTVHDLQAWHHPQFFSRAKLTYLRVMTAQSLRRAARVTTPSDFTRRDLLARTSVPAERVVVVPPRLAAPPTPPGEPSRLTDGRPWFLYPAATYPHKNHLMLVEAFAQAARRLPDHVLVLTGATGAGAWGSARGTADALSRRVDELGLAGRVLRPGYLPGDAYLGLLGGATALVFPSLFEGYGLPVAEAMAVGVPVLAADATALRDVVGAGGLLLDPASPGPWAEAMVAVATSPTEQARLGTAARARFADLTRADPADVLADVYRDAAVGR